jgi:hypothetical protein
MTAAEAVAEAAAAVAVAEAVAEREAVAAVAAVAAVVMAVTQRRGEGAMVVETAGEEEGMVIAVMVEAGAVVEVWEIGMEVETVEVEEEEEEEGGTEEA